MDLVFALPKVPFYIIWSYHIYEAQTHTSSLHVLLFLELIS